MASHICAMSTCLRHLIFVLTRSKKEVGDMLLQSMCDAESLTTLQTIDFSYNKMWFDGGR